MRKRSNHALSRAISVALAALLLLASAATAKPSDQSKILIVRANKGQLKKAAARNKLTVLEYAVDPEGDDLALVSIEANGPPEHAAASLVAREKSIKRAEPLRKARLPELTLTSADTPSGQALLDAMDDVGTIDLGGSADGSPVELWIGFADQPSSRVIRLNDAREQALGRGIVIAVVDSAIDTEHPLLENVMLPGWDFIEERAASASLRGNSANNSTLAKLDQSTMAILDRRTGAVLRGGDDIETMAIDPSTTVLLAAGVGGTLGEIGPAFGHGTMVAGIAHLAAPGARIMPLRAFDSTGYGDTFDVIQAIHYAAAHGATVINLSFSIDGESDELERAIDYAVRRGSICVAAAGNDGASVLVYPAAIPEAIGVASTDLDDFVAPFSNYGNDLVKLAAPGVALITTYPGGGWAAASGTSFSTPWVSGGIALLAERAVRRGVVLDLDRALDALAHSADVQGALALDVGYGRVDFARAGQNLSLEPGGNGNN